MLLRRSLLLLAGIAALACVAAAPAGAAPGSYRVLLAEAYADGPERLAAQVRAVPGVAAVDLVNTGTEEGVTPTPSQLSAYDIVVSIGDSSYLDSEAWGDSLADYVDGGGVVVTTAYDTWEGSDPLGRFETGGYEPLLVGDNVNDPRLLGVFDPAEPLMQGVEQLFSSDNTTNELAPGASVVARWNDGSIAIARKGRVVSVTGFIGDHNGENVWSGDYGRLIVNAVRTIGNQLLSVGLSDPSGGTVTSSVGGINCGAVCTATLPSGTPVSLAAAAAKGFAFAGFSGACTGTSCALTMEGGTKAVTASFVSFGLGKKVKLNKKKGKGTLTVDVGGPGMLVLSGKKVKKQTKSPKSARKVKLPIVAKGKARTQLRNTGKAKVKLQLAYTPAGGVTARTTKTVVLKLAE